MSLTKQQRDQNILFLILLIPIVAMKNVEQNHNNIVIITIHANECYCINS